MKKLAVEFINQMVNLLGKEEAQHLMEALQKESPTSIRLNPFKPVEPSTNPIYINKVYEELADNMAPKGMMVIYGIYENPPMKDMWQKLISDPRSGITFDLYDVGIILFDKIITKQDYIVNF